MPGHLKPPLLSILHSAWAKPCPGTTPIVLTGQQAGRNQAENSQGHKARVGQYLPCTHLEVQNDIEYNRNKTQNSSDERDPLDGLGPFFDLGLDRISRSAMLPGHGRKPGVLLIPHRDFVRSFSVHYGQSYSAALSKEAGTTPTLERVLIADCHLAHLWADPRAG